MDSLLTLLTSGVLQQTYEWVWDNWDNVFSILLAGVAAYYIGSIILGRVVRRIVKTTRHREWHRKDVEKRQDTLAALFINIWRIIVIVVTGVSLFKLVFPAFDLGPMLASAGILGIAFGFGAQSLIKDLLSGIFIITENQYRVGDIVDIEGASGTVERIGTRSTVMRDVDGNVHYFPNGMVMHVINKTMGYSMARFIIAVHPASDLDKIIKIINSIGVELSQDEKWRKKIIEPPEFVSVGEFTGLSLEVIIAGKTQPSDQWSVTAEMRRRLLEALEKSKIELATIPTMMAQASNSKKK
jgi:small-conductance mechanosensitive channel